MSTIAVMKKAGRDLLWQAQGEVGALNIADGKVKLYSHFEYSLAVLQKVETCNL